MIGRCMLRQLRDCSKLVTSSVRLQHHHAPIVSATLVPPPVSHGSYKCLLSESEKSFTATVLAKQKQYILPSPIVPKVTILDPKLNISECQLPAYFDRRQDKLTPTWRNTVAPVEEPDSVEKVEQILMPLMVRIRHRKMKRHKYKKMRKRLVFLYKKLREAKKKKKEKAMKLYVSKWQKMADEFDAEKFATENIEKAKQQHWSTDVVQNWQKSKVGVTTTAQK